MDGDVYTRGSTQGLSEKYDELATALVPPKCMPPGGDKLRFNGTNWLCVCEPYWSSETCETPPPWSQQQKLTNDDGNDYDNFGHAVSLSGDYAVVGLTGTGGPGSSYVGNAYVFTRTGTVWTKERNLTSSDRTSEDGFGSAVSISGAYAVVGAPYGQHSWTPSAAYVFIRSETTWTEQQKLQSLGLSDRFGSSVSISGDYVAVGAPNSNSQRGNAYVFVRSGTQWTQQQKLTADDGQSYDYFGSSVSISGDYIVVGARGTNSNAGSAYVFVRSGTSWTEQQKLNVTTGQSQDNFGYSVSISGDYIVVGAQGYLSSKGSAYVFVRDGTQWTHQQQLVASDGETGDYFGYSVSISGAYVAVGARYDDSSRGSTYVFLRSQTEWNEQQKVTVSDGAGADFFGSSVSISEDGYALVGATGDDDDGYESGSAYVFALT